MLSKMSSFFTAEPVLPICTFSIQPWVLGCRRVKRSSSNSTLPTARMDRLITRCSAFVVRTPIFCTVTGSILTVPAASPLSPLSA